MTTRKALALVVMAAVGSLVVACGGSEVPESKTPETPTTPEATPPEGTPTEAPGAAGAPATGGEEKKEGEAAPAP